MVLCRRCNKPEVVTISTGANRRECVVCHCEFNDAGGLTKLVLQLPFYLKCSGCKGSGIHVKLSRLDQAYLCADCKGTGSVEFDPPKAFEGLVHCTGITQVFTDRHPGSPGVSYEDFASGTMPPAEKRAEKEENKK